MAMDGLLEGVSPSGRVPEQLHQAARGVNIGEGGVEGTHEAVRRVPGAARGGAAPAALLAAWRWSPFLF